MNWHDRWTLYVDSKVLGGTFCIHELDVLTDDQLALLVGECDALLEEWGLENGTARTPTGTFHKR